MRYFLTVDWCGKGRRGIFSGREGGAFGQEIRHTEEEMEEILGCFSIVLSPQSLPFSEEELKGYNKWVPLAEYSNQYGIAYKPLEVAPMVSGQEAVRDAEVLCEEVEP